MPLASISRALCFIVLCLLSTLALAVTPDAVMKDIRDRGAHAVVIQVFDDQEFGHIVLTGVSSGTSKWVNVGAALLPYSDASVSLGLASSLAMALTRFPENVLPLVNSSLNFAATRICLPFMSDEVPNEQHLSHLLKLELSLEQVTLPELQASKAACIQELVSMRKFLSK